MTWKSLWDPKFTNKILMKDSYRDCYGTAIIYANTERLNKGEVTVEQLMNDNSTEAIATAEEYLKLMKPNIAGWEENLKFFMFIIVGSNWVYIVGLDRL